MKRGLKGFAFLVSGLVLGIIGATASVTAIALSAVGMAKVRRANKKLSLGGKSMTREEILSHVDHTLLKPGGYLAPRSRPSVMRPLPTTLLLSASTPATSSRRWSTWQAASPCAASSASLWAPWIPSPRHLRRRPPLRTVPPRWTWSSTSAA